MLNNLSIENESTSIDYPAVDKNLPFSSYIFQCQRIIRDRRPDLQQANPQHDLILQANSPFEYNPMPKGQKAKYGALLIHGLFDCPFSLRDIAHHLYQQNILSRAILLPGHGTQPSDLISVQYQDWIQAMQYGVQTLKQDAEKIFLIGFSTGATLSVYQALQDKQIAGVILLAPAIKIKAPVDIVVGWRYLTRYLNRQKKWITQYPEINYAKYMSLPFNPVFQLTALTRLIATMNRQQQLNCPVFMSVSREDETISSHTAIDLFSSLSNSVSKLLLYSAYDSHYQDKRIALRTSIYPDLNIKHFSHMCIPFAANNQHYGQRGDYIFASHINKTNCYYGAYNKIEEDVFCSLKRIGLTQHTREELTYNPDFENMAQEITQFITTTS